MPGKTVRLALDNAKEREQLVKPGTGVTHANVRSIRDASGADVDGAEISLAFGAGDGVPLLAGEYVNACKERDGLYLTSPAIAGGVLVLRVETEG